MIVCNLGLCVYQYKLLMSVTHIPVTGNDTHAMGDEHTGAHAGNIKDPFSHHKTNWKEQVGSRKEWKYQE